MIHTLAAIAAPITFLSLMSELADPGRLAQWPTPEYRSLQATSYNRESTHRDKPGWFADSDGTGFIREEGGEFVLMEHSGPGCITKMWTPFFYYGFDDLVGAKVRIYLDGNLTPVMDESLINLVCGKGSVQTPWAAYSARAGNLYLPIPFAKSVRVTTTAKPFYYSINYRAYAPGTKVETFELTMLQKQLKTITALGKAITAPLQPSPMKPKLWSIGKGAEGVINLLPGKRALENLTISFPEAARKPDQLRSTVLVASFDGEETIWCPLGDFFCSADSVHPFQTLTRSVSATGQMISKWLMPYKKSAQLKIVNLGPDTVTLSISQTTRPYPWTDKSMHFYARWRPDEIVPGTPFLDWNFVDIAGKGVYVGDAWTVVNMRQNSWWGEGDEKIYIDGDWARGFPSHFGTGSEDYYGWAGGVYPVVADQFSAPFLSNVKVGGLDGHTLGYNILTRTRGLDAIPFGSRLKFDMEASFGTDMREKWDLLGYSATTFFYAMPGAKHNRPRMPNSARAKILSGYELERESDRIKAGGL
ncbi:MAG: glycoside hydrolase family 172 protein [Fimbriimonadaceae bacterium]